MKKILLILLSILTAWVTFSQNYINPSLDSSRNPYETTNTKKIISNSPPTDKIDELSKAYILWEDKRESLLEKIADILWVKPFIEKEKKYSAINYIRSIINFFLAILSFIALVVLIIWFAKMLLSFWKSQEAIESAKKYILAAIIAILLIWLSWFIISWIFTIIYR